MKCKYCGAEVPKESQFCPNCGKDGAPDKPCGVGRADANPKLLLNDT